ncbi:MAG: DUF1573 domain-containing protein [Bacteroidota bacterium]|nr:DUF1573 domain-containing protein [Bacteroidota bacterium]
MKRISIILGILLIASSVSFAQKNKGKKKNVDEMQFAQEMYDYGTLEYGAGGTYKFSFTNTSNKSLVITNVKSSCNCTAPSWSKEPIQPGRSGYITVKYDTHLPGMFNKTVQVFSSAKNSPVRLSIKGKVLPKAGSNKVLRGEAPAIPVNTKSSISNEGGQKTMENRLEEGDPNSTKNIKKALYEKKMQDAKKKKKKK